MDENNPFIERVIHDDMSFESPSSWIGHPQIIRNNIQQNCYREIELRIYNTTYTTLPKITAIGYGFADKKGVQIRVTKHWMKSLTKKEWAAYALLRLNGQITIKHMG